MSPERISTFWAARHGLELGAGHGVARLQPLDALVPGQVEVDGPPDHAAHLVDAAVGHSLVGPHRVGGEVVVEGALGEDVAERVHVGQRVRGEDEYVLVGADVG